MQPFLGCNTFRPYSHETQYCDKKDIFEPWISMTTKVSYCKNTIYLVLCFVKSLPWLFNINLLTDIKISFYRNIAILCAKMSHVNWAYLSNVNV